MNSREVLHQDFSEITDGDVEIVVSPERLEKMRAQTAMAGLALVTSPEAQHYLTINNEEGSQLPALVPDLSKLRPLTDNEFNTYVQPVREDRRVGRDNQVVLHSPESAADLQAFYELNETFDPIAPSIEDSLTTTQAGNLGDESRIGIHFDHWNRPAGWRVGINQGPGHRHPLVATHSRKSLEEWGLPERARVGELRNLFISHPGLLERIGVIILTTEEGVAYEKVSKELPHDNSTARIIDESLALPPTQSSEIAFYPTQSIRTQRLREGYLYQGEVISS